MNVKKEIPTGRITVRTSSGSSIPTTVSRFWVELTKKS